MNEQAEAALAQIMQRALDGLDGAVEFSQMQLPDVVDQLLTWHLIKSLLGFSVGTVLAIFGILLATVFRKKWADRCNQEAEEARSEYERGEKWTRHGGMGRITSTRYDSIVRRGGYANVVFLPPAILLLLLGVVTLSVNLAWLQILIAPKLYILEYGAKLLG